MRRTTAVALGATLPGGLAVAAESGPVGFTAVDTLGQNGTTGGAGGRR